MHNDYSVVLTTVGLENDSEILAEKLLKAKLAACVQIQRIKSFYTWKERLKHTNEYLLLIKTKSALFQEISDLIKQNHSYEIPEIIQIPITNGSEDYLNWIKNSLEVNPQKLL